MDTVERNLLFEVAVHIHWRPSGFAGTTHNSMDQLTRYFLEVRAELLRFLTRRAGRAAAEDAVQDVWLRLRERGDPDAWREPRAVLFRTAANLAIDAHRHQRAADRVFSRKEPPDAASRDPSPEAQADVSSQVQRMAAALAELPPQCREAFLLNRLQDLTHEEIARRLGVSAKTIQRHIQRAVIACAQVLE